MTRRYLRKVDGTLVCREDGHPRHPAIRPQSNGDRRTRLTPHFTYPQPKPGRPRALLSQTQ